MRRSFNASTSSDFAELSPASRGTTHAHNTPSNTSLSAISMAGASNPPFWAADRNADAYMMPRIVRRHDPYAPIGYFTTAPDRTPILVRGTPSDNTPTEEVFPLGLRFQASQSRPCLLKNLPGVSSVIPFTCPSFEMPPLIQIPLRLPKGTKLKWLANAVGASGVVKIAVGQVPFHVSDQQLAYVILQATNVAPISIESMMHKEGGGRTGLRFLFFRAEHAEAVVLLVNRLVLFTRTEAIVFQRDYAAVPFAWCNAVRAQQHGLHQPKPLMPMTAQAAATQ